MNRKRNVKARPKNRQRGPAADAASQRAADAVPMSTQDDSAARAQGQQRAADSLAGSRQRPSGAAPTGRRRALDSGPATPGTTGATATTRSGRAGTARRGAFSPSRRTYLILTSLLVLVGVVATWAGNLQGLWWITPLAGLVIGLALRGAWLIALAAALVGLLGWGLELAWLALSLPIGRAASVVAGIMGFGTGQGGVVIVVTLLLGVLLCLSGAWVGAALRRLLPPPRTA